MQTSVISMPLAIDEAVNPLQPNEALLAYYQGKDWIITATGRHATDLSDRPLTSALGIPVNAKPSPISAAMFNALPDAGSWELPPIPNAGEPNTLGLPDELVIGSVFQIQGHTGPEYF